MKADELVASLRSLMVETGSLACLGCGHEHNCSLHGCAILREAAGALEQVQADLLLVAQGDDICLHCAHCCADGAPLYQPTEAYLEYCNRCDDDYSCFQWWGQVKKRGEAHDT